MHKHSLWFFPRVQEQGQQIWWDEACWSLRKNWENTVSTADVPYENADFLDGHGDIDIFASHKSAHICTVSWKDKREWSNSRCTCQLPVAIWGSRAKESQSPSLRCSPGWPYPHFWHHLWWRSSNKCTLFSPEDPNSPVCRQAVSECETRNQQLPCIGSH